MPVSIVFDMVMSLQGSRSLLGQVTTIVDEPHRVVWVKPGIVEERY